MRFSPFLALIFFSGLLHAQQEPKTGSRHLPPDEDDLRRFVLTQGAKHCFTAGIIHRGTKLPEVGSGVLVRKIGETCFVLTASGAAEHMGQQKWNFLRPFGSSKSTPVSLPKAVPDFLKPRWEWACDPLVCRGMDNRWALISTRAEEDSPVEEPRLGSNPERGDWVMVLGRPGDEKAPRYLPGHVRVVVKGPTRFFIHDCPLRDGDGGSGVFDREFKLVGLNVARLVDYDGKAVNLAASVEDLMRGFAPAAVDVKAAADWVDVGPDVKEGQTLGLAARGFWRVAEPDLFSTPKKSMSFDAGGTGKDADYAERKLIKLYPYGCLLIGIRTKGTDSPIVLGTFNDSDAKSFALATAGLRLASFKATATGRLVARNNDSTLDDGDAEFIEVSVAASTPSDAQTVLPDWIKPDLFAYATGLEGARAPDPVVRTCPVCNGTGKTTCIHVSLPVVPNVPTTDPVLKELLKGSGECEICRGKGTYKCPTCAGSGKVQW